MSAYAVRIDQKPDRIFSSSADAHRQAAERLAELAQIYAQLSTSSPSQSGAAQDNQPPVAIVVHALCQRIDEKLDRVLAEIRSALRGQRGEGRTAYSTAEVAEKVGVKRQTVRKWCNEGRISATRRKSGRGKYGEWNVSHVEFQRYLDHGLLPPDKNRNIRSDGRQRDV